MAKAPDMDELWTRKCDQLLADEEGAIADLMERMRRSDYYATAYVQFKHGATDMAIQRLLKAALTDRT